MLLQKIINRMAGRYYFNWLPDKQYVQLYYWSVFGKKLNLKNPMTYTEKIQWLKLYDHNPLYSQLVDKYGVREYISEKIGSQYLFPLIGVWENVDDIDFDQLPNQFVLKCTHDSGGLIICKDKAALDVDAAKKKLVHSMKSDYYLHGREWPYKNVHRRIICEKYMVDESGTQLKDYKFFCFDGEPKLLFVASDRGIDTRFDFYDMEFNHYDVKNGHEMSSVAFKKPRGFEEMCHLARKLSTGFRHVRVDFYDINGKVYFGELTFYHNSGFVPFVPDSFDRMVGDWLTLPQEMRG